MSHNHIQTSREESLRKRRRSRRRKRGLSPSVDTRLSSVPSGHDHMPMVLHSIISPPRKGPGNHSPFVAIKSMCSQESIFFFSTESPPVDPWI